MRGTLIWYAIIVAVLSSCASVPPSAEPPPTVGPDSDPVLAWSKDGSTIVAVVPSEAGCIARRLDATRGDSSGDLLLPGCPKSLRYLPDGRLLAVGLQTSWVAGEDQAEAENLWDLDPAGLRLERSDEGVSVGGTIVQVGGAVLSARWIPNAGAAAVVHVRANGSDRLVRVAAGEALAVLAGPFQSIDSYDLDPHGKELVFSARREGGFDVALAPTEPGVTNWIPADPLDERRVSWAPRGNKVTYAIEGPAGTVLRTVHIPTGFQLGISLPWSRMNALAWDPLAERFAVSLASPDRSGRIEVMRYGGEEKRILVEPGSELGSRPEPLAGVEGGVLVPPGTLRYDQKVPVVVWVEREPLEWNVDRARLHQNRNVATVVVPERSADWIDAVTALPWVDPARIFIVVERPGSELVRSVSGSGATVLTRDGPPPEGFEVIRTDSTDFRRSAADWIETRLESTKR